MALPEFTMRQLLEAGVHFGHQTQRWNPRMGEFIYGARNGIHIMDLTQTVPMLDAALNAIRETVAKGGRVLFVGTKKQAQEPVHDEAIRAEQPYVNHRWLGGMLTNFVTIRKRVGLLDQLEARQASGDLDRLSKKEASRLTDEMARLQLKLGGVRKMRRLPGAIFVVDPVREKIAVTEARRLEIPVIATGDTNVDPDMIDYIIPANDDAIRSIRLLCKLVADAAIERIRASAPAAAQRVVAVAADGENGGSFPRPGARPIECLQGDGVRRRRESAPTAIDADRAGRRRGQFGHACHVRQCQGGRALPDQGPGERRWPSILRNNQDARAHQFVCERQARH